MFVAALSSATAALPNTNTHAACTGSVGLAKEAKDFTMGSE